MEVEMGKLAPSLQSQLASRWAALAMETEKSAPSSESQPASQWAAPGLMCQTE
jgi:hypothetical protein